MKVWQVLLLAILIVSMPVLSACDLLGVGGGNKDREYYEQQLEAYRKVQEANRKAQEAYNEQVRKGLEEYTKAYQQWQRQQLEQQMRQIQGAQGTPRTAPSTANQS
ncbi:MAG TPA: hypothetical protein VJ377_07750 [Dehalococcoidales bacterium]|nr:hypothetical protein [Dehalococcoidales bacterium]